MPYFSQKNPLNSDKKYYLFALKIVGDFGATIAIPVVIFALIGQKLDTKYNTYPLFLVLCLITSALITASIIHKKAKKYGQEFQNLDKK
jgi:F0F1-type ATP synthase assembly protein I